VAVGVGSIGVRMVVGVSGIGEDLLVIGLTITVGIEGAVGEVSNDVALAPFLLLFLINLDGIGESKGVKRPQVVLLELLLIDLDGLEAAVLLVPLLLEDVMVDQGKTSVVRAPGVNSGGNVVDSPVVVGGNPLSGSTSDQESEDLYKHNIRITILKSISKLLYI